MNKAANWGKKIIDPVSRAAAKEAAQRAGMSVGEWLKSVISERASREGVDPGDFNDQERDELIAERLTRLSQARRRQARRAEQEYEGRMFPSHYQDTYEEDEFRNRDRDESGIYQNLRRNRDHEVPFNRPRDGHLADNAAYRDRDYSRAHNYGAHPGVIAPHAQYADNNPGAPIAGPRHAQNPQSWGYGQTHPQFSQPHAAPPHPGPYNPAYPAYPPTNAPYPSPAPDQINSNTGGPASGSMTDAAGLRQLNDRLANIEASLIPARAAKRRNDGELDFDHADRDDPRNSRQLKSRVEQRPTEHKMHDDNRDEAKGQLPDGNGLRPRELARIESKLNMLLSREAELQTGQRNTPGAPARSPVPGPRASAIEEISRHQQNLDGGGHPARALAQKTQSPEANTNTVVASVRGDLRQLISRIDEMRKLDEQNAKHADARKPAEENFSALEQLRTQMEQVNRAVAGLAPKESITALEHSVRDLSNRVESSRQDGVGEAVLHPIERLIEDLKQSLAAQPAPEGFQAVRSELSTIASRIDQLAANPAATDDRKIDAIFDQTASIRELLTKAVAQPQHNASTDTMQQAIEALGDRIDRIASRGSSPAGAEAVTESVAEIRANLQDILPTQVLDSIQNQISSLSEKVDAAANSSASDDRFRQLSASLDAVQAALTSHPKTPLPATGPDMSHLEDMMRDIRDKLDSKESGNTPAPMDALVTQLQALVEKLDKAPASADSMPVNGESLDISGIEQQIARLTKRMDRAALKPPTIDLGTLESQIQQIAERIDHPNASLEMLSDIQRSTSDLLNQLEESRLSTADAVETATQAAIKEALQAVPAPTSDAGANDPSKKFDADAISQEISGLRTMHDATDRRTHATLNAVHETLEKIVDRLATLETSIEPREQTFAAVSPQSAPIPAAQAVPHDKSDKDVAGTAAPLLAAGPAPLFKRESIPETPATVDNPEKPIENTEPATRNDAPRFAPPKNPMATSPAATTETGERNLTATLPEVDEDELDRAFENDRVVKTNADRAPNPTDAIPVKPLADDDDLDVLLEPGASRPSQNSSSRSLFADEADPNSEMAKTNQPKRAQQIDPDDDPEDHPLTASTSFIAAARRASIAAQAKAEAAAAAEEAANPKKRGLIGDNPLAAAKARAASAASALSGSLERKKSKKQKISDNIDQEEKVAASGSGKSMARKVGMSLVVVASVVALGAYQYMRIIRGPASPEIAAPASNTPSAAEKNATPSGNSPTSNPTAGKPGSPAPAKKSLQQGATLQPGFSKSPTLAATASNKFVKAPQKSVGPIDPMPVATIPASQNRPAKGKSKIKGNASRRGTNLFSAAAAGDAAAQFALGLRYLNGRGSRREPAKAVVLFEKAASQSLAPAQYRLASLLEKGIGTKKDIIKARALYKKAALAGNIRAMHNFAVLSAEGAGKKSDFPAAARWFRQAALHGVRDSQYNLAILYARGLGISRDLKESYKWFAVAAAKGDIDASKKRDQVARRLSSADLAKAMNAAKYFTSRKSIASANVVAPPIGGWTLSPMTAGKTKSDKK